MRDLAKLAGLSSSTVSRALSGHWSVNEKTRARVRALAAEHGYRPDPLARSLRLGRTQAVRLLLPLGHESGQHLSDPFFLTLLGHLADELVLRGYELVISRVIPTDDDWLDRVVDSGRTDGVILIGQSDQIDTIERVARRYPPLVVWGAAVPGTTHLTVGSDNLLGGQLAGRHLIELGRRRLLFVGNEQVPEFAHRAAGFDQAVREGVDARALHLPLRLTFAAAYAAFADYLSREPAPDGVFAASDVVAMSVLKALAEKGYRVPEDVAVIGYDDVAMAAHTSPPLSTIRQDTALGAKLVIDRLFDRLEGREATSIILPPSLIVRASTRPPDAHRPPSEPAASSPPPPA